MPIHRFAKKESAAQKETSRTPMDKALKYLAPKARTVREVERYLDECNYGEYEIQQVVERLLELNYLNDEAYARDFVASRLNTKPVSRQKLYTQLLSHELSSECMEEALSAVTDEEERKNAKSTARKYAAQLQGLEPDAFRERLMRRLVSRGYSFEDAKWAVRMVTEEDAHEYS